MTGESFDLGKKVEIFMIEGDGVEFVDGTISKSNSEISKSNAGMKIAQVSKRRSVRKGTIRQTFTRALTFNEQYQDYGRRRGKARVDYLRV